MRPTLLFFALMWTLAFNASAENIVQIFDLASKQDAELNAARARYKAEIEAKPQARAALLPYLSFGASHSENKYNRSGVTSDYNSDSGNLTLSQTVFNYQLFVRLRQAGVTAQKAGVDLSLAYQNLILRVAESYFAVLTAIDQLEFARAEKRAITRQLVQVRKRFEVGLTTITNVHEAKAAHDLSAAKVITAANVLDTKIEELREITNHKTRVGLSPLKAEIPLISPQPANMEKWTQTALVQNLSLKSTQLGVKVAKLEVKAQRSGHYPTLDLIAGKSKTNTGGGFTGPRDDETDSVSLQLNVPLFSGGYTRSKTREARSRHQESLENLEKQKRSIIRQTRDAYRGVISGISRVNALNQAIISSESALKATTAGYRVGTRNIVDVFQAQQDLFKAKSDFSTARNEYIINLLRLKQAAGTLSVKDIQNINQWLVSH